MTSHTTTHSRYESTVYIFTKQLQRSNLFHLKTMKRKKMCSFDIEEKKSCDIIYWWVPKTRPNDHHILTLPYISWHPIPLQLLLTVTSHNIVFFLLSKANHFYDPSCILFFLTKVYAILRVCIVHRSKKLQSFNEAASRIID